ncbi:MAG TPA: dihydrofolate reductase family protein [Acidimicrobiales bacterium]|nr:dihydrofolate reductase family protein [Acidimicrobiales bacterium]
MGTIRAHEFMTLDGVIDTPTWTMDYGFDPGMGQAIGEIMGNCNAIMLGRTTYEMFEPAWSSRTPEEDPGAPFMNDSTKYIVSSSLKKATWKNSEIVGAYSPQGIRSVKDRVDGGIYVSGSGTLVRALIADGLLDELHLFVFPLTRGGGPRPFPENGATKWSLARSETYDNGVLYLAYAPAS